MDTLDDFFIFFLLPALISFAEGVSKKFFARLQEVAYNCLLTSHGKIRIL